MAGSQPLTDYERRRLENIKRNEQMMSSFKLQSGANGLFSSSKRDGTETKGDNKIPKEKKPKSDKDPIEIRRSVRARVNRPESKSSQRKLDPVVSMQDVNMGNPHQQHLINTIKGLSERTPSTSSSSIGRRDDGNGDSFLDLRFLILKPENIARLMPSGIKNLLFFPCNDRSLIVGGNQYGNVAFWDVDRDLKDGEEEHGGIYLYGPHTGPISGITIPPFSLPKALPPPNFSHDGCIRLMDVEKESFDLVYSSVGSIFCLSHRPHEAKSLYFGGAHGVINVLDERAGKSSSSWALHDQRINTVDFNPGNTNLMATSSADGTVCIWDLRSINANRPKSLKTVDHKRNVRSAYFSPSGSCLATTSASNKVGLLRGVDFMDISIINHDNQAPRSITPFRAIWGWDDSYLFVGNPKGGVDVIPTNYRKMVTLESPHISGVPCRFTAHPHKVGMLAGAAEGWVYIWVSQQEI
ncbi:WD40 repeat [Macleaya cordata]|uniref:WD40 repeat n=1 Tax=Macleaya cordata TaxID=56857 RepID=A0A200PT22_MACCD|nr:WD40 repeat [Macleaya cordata]